MKLTLLSLLAFEAATVFASPVDMEVTSNASRDVLDVLDSRQVASGCYLFASPKCCIPTVCQCANGWIYEINADQMNAGGQGCNPPWGFIAKNAYAHPGGCCRASVDGALVKDLDDGSVMVIEESPVAQDHLLESS